MLIQQGKAKLVTTPEELQTALEKECGIKLKNNLYVEKEVEISPLEQKVLEIISQSEVSVDVLFYKSCLPINILQATLMQLILKNMIVELPGKRFYKKMREPMAKSLVIVESPAKIKTLQKLLGAKFAFESSLGHIRDLPEKEFGIDIENNFEPNVCSASQKKDLIAKLKEGC